MLLLSPLTAWPAAHNDVPAAGQAEADAAQRPKTILDLQPFRRTQTLALTGSDRLRAVTLINLHPAINRWYLLRLSWRDGAAETAYHLENALPHEQDLQLHNDHPEGLVIVADTQQHVCALWTAPAPLEAARGAALPYAPLCGGKLYLRNPVKGHKTTLEATASFLRDTIWGGDKIVGFMRDTFFKDAYRQTAILQAGAPSDAVTLHARETDEAPQPATLAAQYHTHRVTPTGLGLSLQQPTPGVVLGRWYAAQDNPGIYISVIQPNVLAPEILQGFPALLNRLDSVEATSLVYLVAFDLQHFDLGFGLGTEHPRVRWSERIPAQMKDHALPGPDGIGAVTPLVTVGLVAPSQAARTVATFTGGFKRHHGAFRAGQLATRNHGSHYGFIEHGVVFSKLQPGLATLVVLADGTVTMQTWADDDPAALARIQHARQNGVPLITYDAKTQTSAPGPLVHHWGQGNWSGSADKQLRTLRAGACLQALPHKRFLIYGYFSSATPSAMARVFQAYACQYAMLLDMNALEHTYLALYRRQGANILVQHLVQDMNVLDKVASGQYVPRFLGYADNRDFFYLVRRSSNKE
jgi:hypothetical protein